MCNDSSHLNLFCSKCVANRYTFYYYLIDLEVKSMSAIKTAGVNARIDSSIKTQAESILSQLGLPRSVAIDAFYRQIIIHGGLPFSLTISQSWVPAYDEMSKSELNQMLVTGISQIKEGKTVSMDEVFNGIEVD